MTKIKDHVCIDRGDPHGAFTKLAQPQNADSMAYIDTLFFDSLPESTRGRFSKPDSNKPVDMNLTDSEYIDQVYFQQGDYVDHSTTGNGSSDFSSRRSVADCVDEVREKLSINQYSGTSLDLKRLHGPLFTTQKDSMGFRVPDDDAVKFHCLTEDEAVQILWRCFFHVQDNFVIVNKPPGISSHGGKDQPFSVDSLLPRLALKLRLDRLHEPDVLQLTHRLDKEATGALLICRNKETHLKLTEAFANRWIKKTYLCITSGIPVEKEGLVNLPISEQLVKGNYTMVAKRPKPAENEKVDGSTDEVSPKETGRKKSIVSNAFTSYQLLSRHSDTALLMCNALTGVRHQIRVHLSSGLETPILGDHKYSHFGFMAPQRLSKRTLEALNIRQSKVRYLGLHLHSLRIQFGPGSDPDALIPGLQQRRPPPPGFFDFIPKQPMQQSRSVSVPVPAFFFANMKRLGLRFPSFLKWSCCKMF